MPGTTSGRAPTPLEDGSPPLAWLVLPSHGRMRRPLPRGRGWLGLALVAVLAQGVASAAPRARPRRPREVAFRVRSRAELPERVIEREHLWIPVPGGRRLAARLWLPEGVGPDRRVPALLEYLPYNKAYAAGVARRDSINHPYLAAHGYATVRVDIAGTGESDGHIGDEYSAREQADALAILRWIERQPWSNGKVGMMGMSWGGFNALQAAGRRPRQLAAVLVDKSSENRYTDDAHYKGGALLSENLVWGTEFLQYLARPPDPALLGTRRWRKVWLRRLEALAPPAAIWLRHPDERGTAYWRTPATDAKNIEVPLYAVGGWADGYSNAVLRLAGGTSGPSLGLVGPWAHAYPHMASPGPRIGFLQEALRFWDQHLKGIDRGLGAEPRLRVWMQEGVSPGRQASWRPGRWVEEPDWPASEAIRPTAYFLGRGRLLARPGQTDELEVATPQTLGAAGGRWAPFGGRHTLPGDQQGDDARALTFDLAPLRERLEILGAPVVTLRLRSDQARGHVIVRLNDVAPDGRSTRVTYGVLNLRHRDGHDAPKPLEPGREVTVRMPLDGIAHAFAPGHRIRLAISNTYWPMVWPEATPARLTVSTAGSRLELPTRRPRQGEARAPFLPPEGAAPMPLVSLRPPSGSRRVRVDRRTGEHVTTVREDEGAVRDASGLYQSVRGTEEYRMREGEPLSAVARTTREAIFARGPWRTRITVESRQTATASHFRLETTLRAFEGDMEVFARRWDQRIRRERRGSSRGVRARGRTWRRRASRRTWR